MDLAFFFQNEKKPKKKKTFKRDSPGIPAGSVQLWLVNKSTNTLVAEDYKALLDALLERKRERKMQSCLHEELIFFFFFFFFFFFSL